LLSTASPALAGELSGGQATSASVGGAQSRVGGGERQQRQPRVAPPSYGSDNFDAGGPLGNLLAGAGPAAGESSSSFVTTLASILAQNGLMVSPTEQSLAANYSMGRQLVNGSTFNGTEAAVVGGSGGGGGGSGDLLVAPITSSSIELQLSTMVSMVAQNLQNITETDELKLLNFPPKREDLITAIPLTLIFALLLLTGCIGNICTAIVIARPKNKYMHTATNYYLFSLAMSDFLFLILGLPQEMYTLWQRYPYAFGEAFCIIRGYLSEASTYASILTISAFTIERYVAICHPLWAHTMSQLPRAITSIVIIWCLAAICAIPPAAELGIVTQLGPLSHRVLEQSAQCATKRTIYENMFVVSAIVFFIVPMIIVTVLYILIAIELRRSSRMNSNMSKQNQTTSSSNMSTNQQHQQQQSQQHQHHLLPSQKVNSSVNLHSNLHSNLNLQLSANHSQSQATASCLAPHSPPAGAPHCCCQHSVFLRHWGPPSPGRPASTVSAAHSGGRLLQTGRQTSRPSSAMGTERGLAGEPCPLVCLGAQHKRPSTCSSSPSGSSTGPAGLAQEGPAHPAAGQLQAHESTATSCQSPPAPALSFHESLTLGQSGGLGGAKYLRRLQEQRVRASSALSLSAATGATGNGGASNKAAGNSVAPRKQHSLERPASALPCGAHQAHKQAQHHSHQHQAQQANQQQHHLLPQKQHLFGPIGHQRQLLPMHFHHSQQTIASNTTTANHYHPQRARRKTRSSGGGGAASSKKSVIRMLGKCSPKL